MKHRYNDGGGVFREGMEVPANTEDMKSAPKPLTPAQRLGKMNIDRTGKLTPAERRKLERDMKMASDPIPKAKGGTASSRADGCAMRGKTRGKMV
jgi:hypothetical protein